MTIGAAAAGLSQDGRKNSGGYESSATFVYDNYKFAAGSKNFHGWPSPEATYKFNSPESANNTVNVFGSPPPESLEVFCRESQASRPERS